MDKKEFEKYKDAGRVWKLVQKKTEKIVKPEEKLLDIANAIEKAIFDIAKGEKIKDCMPAFPVNLSVNEEAAHYTPSSNDAKVLKNEDVLKLDFGVSVDGFIADGAMTFNFSNSFAKMIEANEKALENALSVVKEGVELRVIGKTIQDTLKNSGYTPVQNLSGHGLGQFEQHSSPAIPNIENRDSKKISDGIAFAIEPFASTGQGFVHESGNAEIFAVKELRLVRNPHARKILEFVAENYVTLPFAERWIEKELKLGDFQRKIALRDLLKNGCLHAYPVLKEEQGKIVTQAEKTVVVFEGKVTVIN